MSQIKRKKINAIMRGFRLVAMDSNGIDENGEAIMGLDASPATLRLLKKMGNADHLVRALQHHWLIMVAVIIRDIHGNYNAQHDFVLAHGKRINDTAEEVQPLLDKIKEPVNEKLVIDWGWIAEILPTSAQDAKWCAEKYKNRAEDYLERFIINRHLERGGVACDG